MKETIIKRYQNRKLYDTAASRYVTLEDIAQMVKRGEEVRILDNRTKKDLTAVTLAQILYEEEKSDRSLLPLATLKKIISNRGEAIADVVRKGQAAIAEVGDRAVEVTKGIGDTMTKPFEELQSKIEGRLNALKDGVAAARDLKNEIGRLEDKIKSLEKRVRELES